MVKNRLPTNTKLIITGFLFLCGVAANGPVSTQSVNEQNIREYFQQRIQLRHQENSLIPFTRKTNLKIDQLTGEKDRIWRLWKETNMPLDQQLPPPTLGDVTNMKYPLHKWPLVGEDPLPFYYLKKGKNSDSKKPLFLTLHGSGPKEDELKATLYLSLRYKDSPSSYFIPQIPNEKRYRWWLKPVQYAWEDMFRLALLNDEIDSRRIYLLGISEGGYGSQRLGAYYADYFAAVGPMAGGEPLENAPPLNYRHVAFSFQTGEFDEGFGRRTFTLAAKTAFDSLATRYPADFKHRIELQKGRGHGIDYSVTTPWLSQYTRVTNPSSLSWVLYPMDGRYRKGFYNVGIDEPLFPDPQGEYDRARFDIRMDKKENAIYLEAALWDSQLAHTRLIEQGKISIFVNNEMVNLKKKVRIYYNGQEIAHTKLNLDLSAMVESCALFGDPFRIYPAKVQIDLK
ncbi:MAG: hypothetical protein K0R59_132 [Sphingobacterium sp.]|jgi:hypothetical protein|nr:hypothetical protein [Sphingobacterium sp.]